MNNFASTTTKIKKRERRQCPQNVGKLAEYVGKRIN